MKELRRLLISQERLEDVKHNQFILSLNNKESHYIDNVLRLKNGDQINLVNGKGSLWKAFKYTKSFLKLNTNNLDPDLYKENNKPLIGLAIALPKKGIENVITMSTEIGIDLIQPIISDRQLIKDFKEKTKIRLMSLMKESLEQSERLWVPEIYDLIPYDSFIRESSYSKNVLIANTREENCLDLIQTLNKINKPLTEIWITIGPEGGWSPRELELSDKYKITRINLNQNILRTSTAAIVATNLLSQWRMTL
tara:strand:- start:3996 stop:4751 length:756 start_codon:yes stop_codon:yes gene_type:complete